MKKLTLELYDELQRELLEELKDELPLLLAGINMGDTTAINIYNQKFVDLLNEYFTGETCSK